MTFVELLRALLDRRAFECRLTPDRALGTLAEAEAFLRDRGLLTRTADCALPSLYEACHEAPYKPGSPGFATWPATRWPWFGEFGDRGYLIAAVHRGKNLLMTGEVAGLIDPICRAEITRMRAADPGWRRLLDHLADAGSASIEDLRTELRLKRQELNALRAPLERCGAILARSPQVTAGEGHQQASELIRWDQAHPASSASLTDPRQALADLIAAAVRAAVVAPEREVRRWFSWQWYWTDGLIDGLVGDGRLRRSMVTSPRQRDRLSSAPVPAAPPPRPRIPRRDSRRVTSGPSRRGAPHRLMHGERGWLVCRRIARRNG